MPLLFALFLLLPAVAGAAPSLSKSIDAYLAPLQAIDVFQGVVLVARGDKVMHRKGYGSANVELAVPNTPDRVFRVASLSKPFTEVALGTLADAGKLSLSDPLSRWLPEFPSGDSITIDMIRTHHAGIPNRNSLIYDEESRVANTLDSLVHAIAAMPLDFKPGAQQRYSNGGYAVLAAVIERASGEPYADYLQHAVCAPLGLAHTRHERDQDLVTNRAFGYMSDPGSAHGLVPAPYQQMATKTGGGSLVSTADDLHRFLLAMHHAAILRTDTWNAIFPPDSVDYFQGRCPGFNVVMARDNVRDIDVIVLANNYSAGMVGTIARDVLAMASGEKRKPPAWRAGVAPDASAATLVGTWQLEQPGPPLGSETITFERRGDEVVALMGGKPVDVLLPQGEGHWLSRTMWSEIVPTGETLALHILWLDRPPVTMVRAKPIAH
jgi:CubicO group peptidase (beta-lactamase class C family)